MTGLCNPIWPCIPRSGGTSIQWFQLVKEPGDLSSKADENKHLYLFLSQLKEIVRYEVALLLLQFYPFIRCTAHVSDEQ